MSLLKGLFQAAMSGISGKNSKAPLPQQQPAQQDTPSASIPDLALVKEALLQLKEMTQVFALAQYAASQIDSKDETILEETKSLLKSVKALSETTEDNLVGYIPAIQGCEDIQRKSAIAGTLDVEKFKPLLLSTSTQFYKTFALAPKYVELIASLKTIQPIPRADEIETRLDTAMTKGEILSPQLQDMIFKYFSMSAENSPEPH